MVTWGSPNFKNPPYFVVNYPRDNLRFQAFLCMELIFLNVDQNIFRYLDIPEDIVQTYQDLLRKNLDILIDLRI